MIDINAFFPIFSNIDPSVAVAVIAGIVTLISIAYNKRIEINKKNLNTKEERYISLLNSLIMYKAGSIEAKSALNSAVQIINLIGSTDVVKKSNDLWQFLINIEKPDKNEQDKKYSELIKAMRKDLYGNKKNNDFPESITLIHFM